MRIAVCKVGVQIQEKQIDGLKSWLNDQQINYTGKNFWWQCVDKGACVLIREGVTSPMRANFTPKITKIQELPGT